MTNNAEKTVTLYGIKNCDTVKKARVWLKTADIDYQFHDVREDGLDKTLIQEWISALGWEAVLNKRSTTWKQLSDNDKATIDEASAINLMLEHPTLIKRPVLNQQVNQAKNAIHNGFKPAIYDDIFKN